MEQRDIRLEAERRYITEGKTLAALAAELGVPRATVGRWCKDGGWVQKRSKAERTAMKKATKKYTDKRALELSKLMRASWRLEDALIRAADQYAKALEDAEAEESESKKMMDGFRAKNLQSLAGAIEGAARTKIMIREAIRASVEADAGSRITVEIGGDAGDLAK